MQNFVNNLITPSVKVAIKNIKYEVLTCLVNLETSPGDFGCGIITPNSITAHDFNLEDWE